MKKILIFALVSIFIFVSTVNAQQNVSVDVKRIFAGRIRAFTFPQVVTIGDEVPILVEFENIGSVEMDSKISIRVFNASNIVTPLAIYVDITKHLLSGQINKYKVVYLPPAIGIYIIEARVIFDSTTRSKQNVLWVLPPSPPVKFIEVPYPIPYPVPAPPPVEIFNASLEYKDKYDLTEGVYLIPITLKNTGNMPLTNVRIEIISDVDYDVYPKFLFSLSQNEQVTFVISVNIPTGTIGEKKIFFEITSNELRRSGEITLNIYPKLTLEMLASLIENYEFLISKIGYEIEITKAKGMNVTLAESYLKRARESLDLAKYFLAKKLIDETKTSIDLTEEYVRRAVIELSMALIPGIELLPYYINLFLLVVIAASSVYIIYTIYKRRKKRIEERLAQYT